MAEFPNDGPIVDLKFERGGLDATGFLTTRISVSFKDMSFQVLEHQIQDLLEVCKVKAHRCRRDGEMLKCESATPQQIVDDIAKSRPKFVSVYSTLAPEACWHCLEGWCRDNGIEFGIAR